MRSSLITLGLLVGLALLGPAPARAQTSGGVRGKVIDENGQPLADAVVTIESQRISRKAEVKTNKKGEYGMIGLQPGPYRITATKDGYQPRFVEFNVAVGNPAGAPDIQLVSLEAIARATGPSEEDLHRKFGRAVEMLRSGQYPEAETLFRELTEIQPEVPEFHQNLAYAYAQQKNWPEAEASYRRALELKPGDTVLVTSLAGVYEESGELDKAGAVLDEAVAQSPDDASLQFERGLVFFRQQKVEEATEAFEKALAADPSLTDAHYYLGTLLVNQGKVTEAVEQLEAYIAATPEDTPYVETAKSLLAALKK
jgi:predicted Zn-dependent protease